MNRFFKVLIPTISILILFLVGCSGNEGNVGDTSASNTDNTLIFGRAADSFSLDPQNANEIETWKATKNIYETLVDMESETTNIIPKLAKSWDISEDKKTWTFQLEEGINFHDDTPFNAAAVVYNFERMADKNFPNRHGDFSVYRGMFNGFKGEGSIIEEVVAVSEYEVKFVLSEPQATFLSNLSMHAFGIISPKAIEKYGKDINKNPVGTGPFKFVSWKANDAITLEKNSEYWVEGQPKLDKLIYKVIPDNSARLTALKNNEIDIMDALNPSDLETVKNDQNLEVVLRPALNVAYLTLNNSKEPLNDVKVRQAISYAIDKQALADAFYYGLAKPVKNAIPSTNWAYNNDLQEREVDFEKAKQLLAEAGYPEGLKLKFSVTTNSRIYMQQPTKMAETIKSNLSKIGVEVEIVTYEWASYLSHLNSAEHQLGLVGWVGDNGDPDNFLYSLLSKNNAVAGAAQNNSMFINDEVSKLLLQAKGELDEQKRKGYYDNVQKIAFEQVPIIPLVEVEEPVVTVKRVQGYFPHPTGAENMSEVSLQ